MKPIELVSFSLEVQKAAKLPDGTTEIPFEFPLKAKPGQTLYETYVMRHATTAPTAFSAGFSQCRHVVNSRTLMGWPRPFCIGVRGTAYSMTHSALSPLPPYLSLHWSQSTIQFLLTFATSMTSSHSFRYHGVFVNIQYG